MQGAVIADDSLTACDNEGIRVPLQAGKRYLVEIRGSTWGRYRLTNGTSFEFDKESLPRAILPSPFEFVKPGPPIDRWLRGPTNYVILGNPAHTEATLVGKNVKMELYDLAGTRLAVGAPRGAADQVVSLVGTSLGQAYVLRLTPTKPPEAGHQMMLSWTPGETSSSSGNLILNPGAEEGPDPVYWGYATEIPGWSLPFEGGMVPLVQLPTYFRYDHPESLLTGSSPGPARRGARYFAGGYGPLPQAILQAIPFQGEWLTRIATGLVRFELSAFLGGDGADDGPTVHLSFFAQDGAPLEDFGLEPVGAMERQGLTGLYPVGTSEFVPPDAVGAVVHLTFPQVNGDRSGGYADNLELLLHDHSH